MIQSGKSWEVTNGEVHEREMTGLPVFLRLTIKPRWAFAPVVQTTRAATVWVLTM